MSGHCVFISGLTPITDRWVQLGILHSLCATIDLEWKKSLYWVVKHCRSSPFVGHSDFSSSHVTNATRFSTLPSLQNPRDCFSPCTTTMSPTDTGTAWGSPLLWRWLSRNSNRYSFLYLLQKLLKVLLRCRSSSSVQKVGVYLYVIIDLTSGGDVVTTVPSEPR